MQVSKRPCPPGFDPDLVSPSSLQPKRPRVAAGSSAQPPTKGEVAKRPREAAGSSAQTPPKGPVGVRSPVAGLHPASCAGRGICCNQHADHHGVRLDKDTWTAVAKCLSGSDLVCLSLTCKWFHMLVGEDSIWRSSFLKEFNLPASLPHLPQQLHSWRRLYSTNSRSRHRRSGWRLRAGAFFLNSTHMMLMGKLPKLQIEADYHSMSVERTGSCVLNNACPGVWIADVHRVRCLGCKFRNCESDMLVLDVQNANLLLEDAYLGGTMVHEDIGEFWTEQEMPASFSAVCDLKRVDTLEASGVFDTDSWSLKRMDPEPEDGERPDLFPQARITSYGVALHFNIQSNNRGMFRRFQLMKNMDGQILSLRILHCLL